MLLDESAELVVHFVVLRQAGVEIEPAMRHAFPNVKVSVDSRSTQLPVQQD